MINFRDDAAVARLGQVTNPSTASTLHAAPGHRALLTVEP